MRQLEELRRENKSISSSDSSSSSSNAISSSGDSSGVMSTQCVIVARDEINGRSVTTAAAPSNSSASDIIVPLGSGLQNAEAHDHHREDGRDSPPIVMMEDVSEEVELQAKLQANAQQQVRRAELEL